MRIVAFFLCLMPIIFHLYPIQIIEGARSFWRSPNTSDLNSRGDQSFPYERYIFLPEKKDGQKTKSLAFCTDAQKADRLFFSHMREIGKRAFSRFKFILFSTTLSFCFLATAYPMDISLQWHANPEPDLAGYKIYYKTEFSGPIYDGTGALEGDSPIDIGDITDFTLHGLLDGADYFFAVTAYNFEDLESNYSNEVGALSISLLQGFNLISLPVTPEDSSLSALFPDALAAYEFDGVIQEATSLEPGKGYWVKVSSDQSYTVCGEEFVGYSATLSEGWHLIGAAHGNATPLVDPVNAIAVMYGFDDAYYEVNQFSSGQGYWVKIQEECDLVIEAE
jgi:hypothetical protein